MGLGGLESGGGAAAATPICDKILSCFQIPERIINSYCGFFFLIFSSWFLNFDFSFILFYFILFYIFFITRHINAIIQYFVIFYFFYFISVCVNGIY